MIMHKVSVIIPVLNERYYLEDILLNLKALSAPAHEIIVVDGGSSDGTLEQIQQYHVKVIKTKEASRAVQMNEGARVATGNYLCFLHADTTVPRDLVQVIVQTLHQPKIACGGFVSIMRGKQNVRWLTSLLNYTKTYGIALLYRPHLFFRRGFRVLFGDQVMFCRKTTFWACGGFNEEFPIMEEIDFCRRIVKYGHIKQIHRVVASSDRRIAKLGFFKSHMIYLGVFMMWAFGVSPVYLKKWYEDVR